MKLTLLHHSHDTIIRIIELLPQIIQGYVYIDERGMMRMQELEHETMDRVGFEGVQKLGKGFSQSIECDRSLVL